VELARAMSTIVTVFALAPVVAPLIGSAVLLVATWPWMFAALAVFAALCMVGVALMPETLPAERRTDHGFVGAMRQYRTILTNRSFRYAAAIAALGSTALFSYISGSPAALMGTYGMTAGAFALTFAALSLCFAFGAQVNKRLLRTHPVVRLLRANVTTQLVASCLVLAGALLTVRLPLFLAPLVIALMTVAGVNSNAMALALDPFPGSAASAAALVGGLQMLMGAIASAALSAMTMAPPVEMGLGMTVAGTAAVLLVLRTLAHDRRDASGRLSERAA